MRSHAVSQRISAPVHTDRPYTEAWENACRAESAARAAVEAALGVTLPPTPEAPPADIGVAVAQAEAWAGVADAAARYAVCSASEPPARPMWAALLLSRAARRRYTQALIAHQENLDALKHEIRRHAAAAMALSTIEPR